ncbi:MAG: cob(I)yrinic acid a,c-diamide adenosyltransferase [Myxococcota bacterium]
MVKINKVYTRTGDAGETGLVDGSRVAKDSLRVEAYGTLDELNAALGLARAWNERGRLNKSARWLDGVLRKLQDELFDLGSELATPAGYSHPGQFRVGKPEIKALEALIDQCSAEIDPLLSFVLPGGGPVSGFLHLARTIARRAERVVVQLLREEPGTGEFPLAYLNRLSDLLFVLSRWAGKHRGETEYLWERGLKSHGSGGAKGRRGARKSPAGASTSARNKKRKR